MEVGVDGTRNEEVLEDAPIITMTVGNMARYRNKIKPVGEDTVLVFDIDGCLYSNKNGLVQLEEEYITEYYTRLSQGKECPDFQTAFSSVGRYQEMFCRYLGVEPGEFSSYHSSFDFGRFLREDVELRDFLHGVGIRKWCFTNGPRHRALMILDMLGVRGCFEGVICLDEEAADFMLKPQTESYEFVTSVLGIGDVGKVHFFDDQAENVAAAREFGWNGYLIEDETRIIDVVRRVVESVQASASVER